MFMFVVLSDVGNMVSNQHHIKSRELLVFPNNSGKLGCASQR